MKNMFIRLKLPAYSCGGNLAWQINPWFRSALGKTPTFFRNIRSCDALIFHLHGLTNSGSSSPHAHELADAHQSKCKEITPAVSSSSRSCIHGVYWPRGRLWRLIILPGDWCVVRPCGFLHANEASAPIDLSMHGIVSWICKTAPRCCRSGRLAINEIIAESRAFISCWPVRTAGEGGRKPWWGIVFFFCFSWHRRRKC